MNDKKSPQSDDDEPGMALFNSVDDDHVDVFLSDPRERLIVSLTSLKSALDRTARLTEEEAFDDVRLDLASGLWLGPPGEDDIQKRQENGLPPRVNWPTADGEKNLRYLRDLVYDSLDLIEEFPGADSEPLRNILNALSKALMVQNHDSENLDPVDANERMRSAGEIWGAELARWIGRVAAWASSPATSVVGADGKSEHRRKTDLRNAFLRRFWRDNGQGNNWTDLAGKVNEDPRFLEVSLEEEDLAETFRNLYRTKKLW